MTQKQLAEKSGVSLRSLQRFENGEDIQVQNLLKILKALDLIDNISVLVPDVTERPSVYLMKEGLPKRVRLKKEKTNAKAEFQWGDGK